MIEQTSNMFSELNRAFGQIEAAASGAQRGDQFDAMLQRMGTKLDPQNVGDLGEGRHEPSSMQKLRHVAQDMLRSALFSPLMAQMRKPLFGKPIMHGGQAEDIFTQHFDKLMIDRISSTSTWGLTEAIVDKFAGQVQGLQQAREALGAQQRQSAQATATQNRTTSSDIDLHG